MDRLIFKYYPYLTSEIAKWELNVLFSFMSVLLEDRMEMLILVKVRMLWMMLKRNINPCTDHVK